MTATLAGLAGALILMMGSVSLDAAAPPGAPLSGARTAASCEFAPVVALQLGDGASGGVCTGTLIHPQVVLYASHCGTSVSAIHFGDEIPRSALQVRPQRCARNEARATGSPVGDWAYCVLSEPTEGFPVIPLASPCEMEAFASDVGVTLVGFGKPGDPVRPKRIGTTTTGTVDADAFSVVADGVGPCSGDSGGPALIQVEDGSFRVAGIASLGSPDCSAGTGWYARADAALESLEAGTGVDLTPCDGVPANDCQGFLAMPGSGQWSNGCAGTPTTPPGLECGAESAESEASGDSGAEEGTAGDALTDSGGETGMMDETTAVTTSASLEAANGTGCSARGQTPRRATWMILPWLPLALARRPRSA